MKFPIKFKKSEKNILRGFIVEQYVEDISDDKDEPKMTELRTPFQVGIPN